MAKCVTVEHGFYCSLQWKIKKQNGHVMSRLWLSRLKTVSATDATKFLENPHGGANCAIERWKGSEPLRGMDMHGKCDSLVSQTAGIDGAVFCIRPARQQLS